MPCGGTEAVESVMVASKKGEFRWRLASLSCEPALTGPRVAIEWLELQAVSDRTTSRRLDRFLGEDEDHGDTIEVESGGSDSGTGASADVRTQGLEDSEGQIGQGQKTLRPGRGGTGAGDG